MLKLITTLGPLGHSPVAPGTVGSLAAVPLGIFAIAAFGGAGFVMLTCGIMILGTICIQRVTRDSANHDPSEIVIDELVGQWITLWPLAFWANSATLLLASIAFALFRLFDIWKPWPVSVFDARDDAIGVMADDVVAGLIGAMLLCIGLAIWGAGS